MRYHRSDEAHICLRLKRRRAVENPQGLAAATRRDVLKFLSHPPAAAKRRWVASFCGDALAGKPTHFCRSSVV